MSSDDSRHSTSNIALMLREEHPSVAFDTQFHLFYIVDDGDIYLSRFDMDPVKDTGGTLHINIKFRQYDHVSIIISQCSYWEFCMELYLHHYLLNRHCRSLYVHNSLISFKCYMTCK